MEYQALPTVDLALAAEPDAVVAGLLEMLPSGKPSSTQHARRTSATTPAAGPFSIRDVASSVYAAIGARKTTLTRLPIGWSWEDTRIDGPLDYMGADGGGGIGSGPGMAVGIALGVRDTEPDRMTVAILGDGDFLMGGTAMWTAVHAKIPLLVVVANNRSYLNDELHQQRVAEIRDRPTERRWIGQRIDDPAVDIASFARSFGATGFGPIATREAMDQALRDAINIVEAGGVAVVDALVLPTYDAKTVAGLTRGPGG